MMQYFAQFFDQASQSKYDFRMDKARPFSRTRVLLPSTKLLSYSDIKFPLHRQGDFITIYAGVDPNESSRLLVRNIVKLNSDVKKNEADDADSSKDFYCLEEATITKNFAQAFPTVQI